MEKYKIIYSPKFWPGFNEILNYLISRWSPKIADEFLDIFDVKIGLLLKNPKVGRISSKYNDIRSISITKHNRLYYRIKGDSVMIVTIFDTRQNPIKNKFE